MSTLTEVTVTPYAVVNDAWQVYRRAQEIPFPAQGAGDLMAAQSRLFTLTEPYTRTRIGGGPRQAPDLDAIEDAADALIAAVAWHCGDAAADWVADGDERPAA